MLQHINNSLTLGLGLIGIGRPWGYKESHVPSEEEVATFLYGAYSLGIQYFDTAASYGTSEERVGKFLSKLTTEQREKIIVATKFGDHWNTVDQTAYVDHSFEALKKSLDRSINYLKQIELLYLHKANMQSLTSPDVKKAFEYAKSKGISNFGASVSDVDSGEYVCKSDFYDVIQLPYNQANTNFANIIDLAKAKGKIVIINRPFNMGSMLYNSDKPHEFTDKVEAYKTILRKNFHGVVLTGTKSLKHLKENLKAFEMAKKSLRL